MTTSTNTCYGVIDFLPPETFHDPSRGMDAAAKLEMAFSAFSEAPSLHQSVGWPVKEAILNEGFYTIETVTPTARVTLKFCPDKSSEGFYNIHRLPTGIPERGIIFKVIPVRGDETHPSVTALHKYSHRYLVETAADNRSRSHLYWRVGLNTVRQINETISDSTTL